MKNTTDALPAVGRFALFAFFVFVVRTSVDCRLRWKRAASRAGGGTLPPSAKIQKS